MNLSSVSICGSRFFPTGSFSSLAVVLSFRARLLLPWHMINHFSYNMQCPQHQGMGRVGDFFPYFIQVWQVTASFFSHLLKTSGFCRTGRGGRGKQLPRRGNNHLKAQALSQEKKRKVSHLSLYSIVARSVIGEDPNFDASFCFLMESSNLLMILW